jgi:hypothetical protein
MKRRNFLIALGVVPPLVLAACNGDKLPKTPTIVKVKVTDDKGLPFENFPLEFYGYRSFGGSVAGGWQKEDTFKIEKSSDKMGNVEFSQIVPENTTIIYVLIGSEVNLVVKYDDYVIQSKKGGINIGNNSEQIAVYPDYTNSIDSLILGETNEYELILTKK